MSMIVDKQFINIASSNLRNFKWKKDTLANCSCPVCGDSKSDKKKARGYFYTKHGRFFYKCHNCDYWGNLSTFLKEVSPSIHKEYCMQLFQGSMPIVRKKESPEEMFKKLFGKSEPVKKKPTGTKAVEKYCTCLKDMPKNHPAVQFAELRLIPKEFWKVLYFTDFFGVLGRYMDDEQKLMRYDPRLVIPFYNREGDVVAIQGRAINMKDEANARETIKYLTVKADKSIERLWYGMWRADPKKKVYAVEGPIDSMFIPNTIAMVGASSAHNIPARFAESDLVFVLDNEPRNKQIVKFNQNLIDSGHKICIWPRNIIKKDINDMVYDMSPKDVKRLIDENTFGGLEASLRLKTWSKV